MWCCDGLNSTSVDFCLSTTVENFDAKKPPGGGCVCRRLVIYSWPGRLAARRRPCAWRPRRIAIHSLRALKAAMFFLVPSHHTKQLFSFDQTQLLKLRFYSCRICCMNAIQTAISSLGGPAATAQVLNCTVQAVCFYRDGKREFPAKLCPTIERATNGAVTCEQLRPDVEWAVLRRPRRGAKKAA